MRISKSLIAVGGVVVAAAAIGFTNPKAVRAAVAAALVQVTNTASNPVVNSDVTLSAANIVQLECIPKNYCVQVEPGGALADSFYKVPAGQTLIITDVMILSPADSKGPSEFSLVPQENIVTGLFAYSVMFQVPDDGLSHHFALTRGIAWPSGSPLLAAGSIYALLNGYVTNS